MSDLKQRIRTAIPLTTLIGESVSLQNRSGHAAGLCPFHEEKTPSFYVYDDHYHCFGCGAHGDAISYVRKIQGLSFVDALRFLANKAGIPCDELDRDGFQTRKRQGEHRKQQILQAAKTFFIAQLTGPHGQYARTYLQERGLAEQLEGGVGFGLALNEADSLCRHLLSLGFQIPELDECSLIHSGKSRNYDFFQNRLIIPVHDEQGRLIAFGGRALGEEQPKYKNSRYDKSFYLFGLDRARQAIRKKNRAIVVEGYLDAIRMWLHGFDETVACQGTALTFEHIRKLDALTNHTILLFDGDTAGHNAALKALDHAFSFAKMFFRVVQLPDGEDPDSFLKKNGREGLDAPLQNAEELLSFAINAKLRNAPETGQPELIQSTILPWLGQIKDPLRRAFFMQKLSNQTGIPRNLLAKDLRPPPPAKVRGTTIKEETPASLTPLPPLEKEFLAHLYFAPPQTFSPEEAKGLIAEHLELQGIWHSLALEFLCCLERKEEPSQRAPGTWQCGFDPQVIEFMETLHAKEKAYEQGKGSPFTRIRLEGEKRSLKLSLENLKKEIMQSQWEKEKNPEMWSLLTHSLLKTTKELAVIESLLRGNS